VRAGHDDALAPPIPAIIEVVTPLGTTITLNVVPDHSTGLVLVTLGPLLVQIQAVLTLDAAADLSLALISAVNDLRRRP
jgi:hypothetical protein